MSVVYYLFLDDERVPLRVTWVDLPPRDWTIVRNYEEFVKIISERGLPEIISFDHDLGLEQAKIFVRTGGVDYSRKGEKTGYHCARWLIDYCLDKNLKLLQYFVHSKNPVGATNILHLLNQFKTYTE